MYHISDSATFTSAPVEANMTTATEDEEDAWWLQDDVAKPNYTDHNATTGTDPTPTSTPSHTTATQATETMFADVNSAAVVTCRMWLMMVLLQIVSVLTL